MARLASMVVLEADPHDLKDLDVPEADVERAGEERRAPYRTGFPPSRPRRPRPLSCHRPGLAGGDQRGAAPRSALTAGVAPAWAGA